MIFLIVLILFFTISYLAVFVLAHQDANMIKPLTLMTIGMIILLIITAITAIASGFAYVSIVIFIVVIGLIRFLFYLTKY